MAAPSYQQRLIEFLQKPGSYPKQPQAIEIIQTHASILAIASPLVYKFKKQFDFGFMDFRDLGARRENCLRELALNRRLCPAIYLEVLPLYEEEGELTFSPGGTIVDYVLKMKQLDDGYFLHQLLQKKQLNTQLLEQVLQHLKNFYEQQAPDPAITAYGTMAHLRQNTDENFKSLAEMTKELISPEALDTIEREVNRFYLLQAALLQKRVKEGRIRDCHGDLHLDHIHMQEGRLCIFDCIEFSDRFRYTDVAADIAFLAMDLDFAGRPDLGAFVSNRMAELLQDTDMLKLMDYYKSYRACVRAKVEGIRALQKEVSEAEKTTCSNKARKYMQLALQYSLFGSAPFVLIICGRIGSGKSTLAGQLAALLNARYLSSDRLRKKSAGIPLYQRSSASRRATLYSQQRTEEVYRQLIDQTLEQLQSRHSMIIDATFGKKQHRQAFMQALEKTEAHYCFVECRASDQTVKDRLQKRENQPTVSDARMEDFHSLYKWFEPLLEIPTGHYIAVNTEKSLRESIKALLNALRAIKQAGGQGSHAAN